MELDVTDNLYLAVYHRNHLGMLSANALNYNNVDGYDVYSYDFTDGQSKAYGTSGYGGQGALTGGKFGMYSGDADGNGDVNLTDLDIFVLEFGQPLDYYGSDFDLNGDVNLTDLDYYVPNFGYLSQIP